MASSAEFSPPFTMLEGRYGGKENGSSAAGEDPETPEAMKETKAGKPPRNLSVIRHCVSTTRLADSTDLDLVARLGLTSPPQGQSGFLPVFRSGSCSEMGPKPYMEDEHLCIDNLVGHLGALLDFPSPGAFYGVFDGHGGTDAALFARKNLLKFIIEDSHFPTNVEKAVKSAFMNVDHAFADSCSLDRSSGTTALAALIFGRNVFLISSPLLWEGVTLNKTKATLNKFKAMDGTMLIANAGDCRAVLGKRGRAIELSRDHKPNSNSEKLRIERLGGIVYDGYLNGQLSVARALGDWHMKGSKGSACPLSAEPELRDTTLTEEDEFLILGCDGLWDVMSSQCAVTMARKELMIHNDPERCSRELVQEALKRNSCDNVTVVVVCFSPDPPPHIEITKLRVRRSISLEGLHLLKGALDSN